MYSNRTKKNLSYSFHFRLWWYYKLDIMQIDCNENGSAWIYFYLSNKLFFSTVKHTANSNKIAMSTTKIKKKCIKKQSILILLSDF